MRTLHLVDIENLVGECRRSDVALAALDSYIEASHWAPRDLVAIAANRRFAAAFGFSLSVPHRLLVTGFAPDAADEALLEFAAGDWVPRSVDRVALGSGDGIFAPMIERFGRAGLATSVISRPGSLAWRLREVAADVRFVPDAGDELRLAQLQLAADLPGRPAQSAFVQRMNPASHAR